MDPDASDWLLDADESSSPTTNESTGNNGAAGAAAVDSNTSSIPNIPTGPPVPNPYALVLEVPCKKRQYTHWARNKHLQYKYLEEYLKVYYDDYIDYMNKRLLRQNRDTPRPQEWPERALKLYAKDIRLSANDRDYWYTTKNIVKPTYSIFHPVHSRNYFDRQYKSILC